MINMSELIELTQSLIADSKQVKADSNIRKPYIVSRKRFYNDKDFIGSIEFCMTWGYIRIDYNGNIREINEPNLTITETMILENYIGWLRSEIQNKLEKIDCY